MRDAVVIGSGPNGLSAAIALAQAGRRVTVYEAEATLGGSARTAPLTLHGFLHDQCSSVFPLAVASPFFRGLPLDKLGVTWLHARYPLAHPLDDGQAVVLDRSIDETSRGLGVDGPTYARLMTPFARDWQGVVDGLLGPLRWPAHIAVTTRFGWAAVRSAAHLAGRFHADRARALMAGLAAHSGERLDAPLSAAVALLLGTLAHAVGWPVARGGAGSVSAALAFATEAAGGRIVTQHRVTSLDELPGATLTLCDVAPEDLARVAGDRLPAAFRRRLNRFRRSAGVVKLDWALDGPIPWRADACARAVTVHVGGTFEDIAASERAVHDGRVSTRPFVIVTQPSVCDSTRAPAGRHVAWGYCHVPVGSSADMTAAIEDQVERFAPGFRDRMLARRVSGPADLMQSNANLIGGDISGGANSLRQVLARPTWRTYATPDPTIYLCSASTPPGAGVHGMCGYWAARTALGVG